MSLAISLTSLVDQRLSAVATSAAYTIPVLAIIAMAIMSLYDGHLSSPTALITLLTVGVILIVWKRSVQ